MPRARKKKPKKNASALVQSVRTQQRTIGALRAQIQALKTPYISSMNPTATNATNISYYISSATSTFSTRGLTTTTSASGPVGFVCNVQDDLYFPPYLEGIHHITQNHNFELHMPDGSIIEIEHGNYKVIDKDTKIQYRANRIREFNEYVSASDMLQEFVKWIASQNIRMSRKAFMDLPVELFVQWLVIQAAHRDNDPLDGLPDPLAHPALVAARPMTEADLYA